jgi:hypothetical protein
VLDAVERAVTPPLEVAIVGDSPELRAEVYGRLLPASVVAAVGSPDGDGSGAGAQLTPLLADRLLVDGRPTAYVCEHFACQLPVTTPADLRAQLDAALASRRP